MLYYYQQAQTAYLLTANFQSECSFFSLTLTFDGFADQILGRMLNLAYIKTLTSFRCRSSFLKPDNEFPAIIF